ncbi:hypothetical protein N9W41_00985 [bacterium]|nr:hypothetical protein [bacterium]
MKIKLHVLILVSSIFMFYQNCSQVKFDALDTSFTANNTEEEAPITTRVEENEQPVGRTILFENDVNDPGLLGGHFDFDTSTELYNFSEGETNHHIHEYDDKHSTNKVDFFDMIDGKLVEINEAISDGNKEFYIIVANADLSTGGVLAINDKVINVKTYQDNFLASDSAYTKYSLNGSDSSTKLSHFSISFSADALLKGGLMATETKCVRANDAGKLGEYRNGALTIQVVDAANFDGLNPDTLSASSGLLWEATLFWHKDGKCYK